MHTAEGDSLVCAMDVGALLLILLVWRQYDHVGVHVRLHGCLRVVEKCVTRCGVHLCMSNEGFNEKGVCSVIGGK